MPRKHADVAEGPAPEDLIACVRGHGIDAPTDPDAFKRWLKGTADTSAVDAALRDCKMSLGPGPSQGPVKPGGMRRRRRARGRGRSAGRREARAPRSKAPPSPASERRAGPGEAAQLAGAEALGSAPAFVRAHAGEHVLAPLVRAHQAIALLRHA